MEFRLSKEHEMFKRSVREYCEKNVAPRSREIDEKENGIPDDIIKGLADIGVFGCTVPGEVRRLRNAGRRNTVCHDRHP
jgi:alkylation response protein AidB-like acyl-CoA dehydrogenase